jgi:hypothetical protein
MQSLSPFLTLSLATRVRRAQSAERGAWLAKQYCVSGHDMPFGGVSKLFTAPFKMPAIHNVNYCMIPNRNEREREVYIHE